MSKNCMYNMCHRLKIILLILFILPLLNGCRIDESSYELTNYKGKSVNTFEKKTKTELVEESNGIYKLEGALQLIAPKGDITSIIVLNGAKNYKIFGVEIGMDKTEAENKLKEIYGAETNKTLESEKNSVTHTYKNSDSEIYISFDIDTNKVTEMSYYYFKSDKQQVTEDTSAGELIALIGDIRVYYNEAMVYLKSAQETYETEYGKDIWNVDIFGDGKTFGEHIKDEVIKQITQIKVIRDKAEQMGITLTDEEKADAASYAAEHFAGLSDADIDRYLVTRDLLEQVYSENLLAEKVFETLTIDVDTNVSDYESRQITVQHILIYGTELDNEGNRKPLSFEQREKAYQKVISLLERARSGEDFYSLAEANSEDEVIEYTFGRGTGPEEFSNTFEQAAFNLKTGEISDIITTDYGWHIIYCVTDFNEDATTEVKEKIIEERRTKLFAELYEQWSSDYDVVINSEVWDAISLKD
ncbi:MAG TPA: peptidylprolyl isomerase [Mobilitalea sp.]|nr:peptidylprolyl isomerase [Mobilitalea sp.]